MNILFRKIFLKLGWDIQRVKKEKAFDSKFWDGLLPTKERFKPSQIMFAGHQLYFHDFSSFILGFEELFNDEIYKFNAKVSNPYIIDCGANMGMSVVYFKHLYPKAEILAIEADPHIYTFLCKNIASYNLNDVTTLNNAVWDSSNDSLSFFSEGGAGGRISVNGDSSSLISVKTIRLRQFLNRKVDFLKLDIEGAEYKVIVDCADVLNNVETLFIEYHSFPNERQNLHDILKIVQDAGFTYHIKTAYVNKFPFIERKINNGMDLQLNIFCYKQISL